MRPELIQPTPMYEASHDRLVGEFTAHGEPLIPWVIGEKYDRFADYIATLNNASHGIGLPPGFVAHSTFWLIVGDEIAAVSNLRHELSPALLANGGHIGYGVRPSMRGRGLATTLLGLTLQQAQKVGLKRVCLTCDRDNVASSKTIIRNGGVLDDEVYVPDKEQLVSRYWISL